jgi:hypothetical protein
MLKSRSIWKEVLHEIYVLSPSRFTDNHETGMSFSSSRYPLARKLRIDGKKLIDSIDFLKEQGLIEVIITKKDNKYAYSEIRLTKDGFNVASKNENNSGTTNFARIVALAAVIQILWTMFMFTYKGEKFVFVNKTNTVLILGLILIIAYLLYYLVKWMWLNLEK